ncbi:MAG: glycosyltransferase family 4 protein [Spirochaetia bacterium]|nr:glycosyltransferase family 4 protein [Spirochaetia bacterium]
MAKRRVLFLEYFPLFGGGQRMLLSIIGNLKDDYDAEVLIFNRGGIETHLKKMGIKTHFMQAPAKPKFRYFFYFIPFIMRLYNFLKRGKYSLVYSSGFFSTKLAAIPCAMAKIPLIWHKHLIISRGYFSYTASQSRMLSLFTSKIICVSEASRRSMESAGIKRDKLVTVYNGTKAPERVQAGTRAAVRKKYGIKHGDFLCGSVGYIRLDKGFDLLVKAAAVLKNEPQIKFMQVGKAEESDKWYEAKLKKDAADNNLENMIFAGYGDKYDFMPAFDLYVMPSPNEPFGLVTIEAMSLGIPAAGFASGGTAEIITDGRDGFLTENISALGLAAMIKRAYLQRKKLKKMGAAARKTVAERFGTERQMMEIKGIIESVLRTAAGGIR